MDKEKEELCAAWMAQIIGQKVDSIEREKHSWHGNTYQKYMAQHPLILNIIREVISDEEIMKSLKENFKYLDSDVPYRLEKEVKMTTTEKQQELIDTLQNGLDIWMKGCKIMDEDMTDPESMAKGMVFNSLRDILFMLRTATMKSIVFDCPEMLNQSLSGEIGAPVAVRPCGEEYGKKTYLGIYLGDFPLSFSYGFDKEDNGKVIVKPAFNNPAIFIPSLKKTVFGCGSWWRRIKNMDDIKKITDDDISNTWYVKLMKEMGDA